MITVSTIHRFITSLGFSIIVETIVVIALIRYVLRNKEIPLRRIWVVGLLVTFATIPYVWFVFPYARDWPRSEAVMYAEVFIAVVEAIIYRYLLPVGWKAAFMLSILSNLSSYLLGPWLRAHKLWIYW
jgi:hypothetical protein